MAIEGVEETSGQDKQQLRFESDDVVAEARMEAPRVMEVDEEADGDVARKPQGFR